MPLSWRHTFSKPLPPLLTKTKMTCTHDVSPTKTLMWWILLFFSNVSNRPLKPKTLHWAFGTFDWSHQLVMAASWGNILTSERNPQTIQWKVREGPLPGNRSGNESLFMRNAVKIKAGLANHTECKSMCVRARVIRIKRYPIILSVFIYFILPEALLWYCGILL